MPSDTIFDRSIVNIEDTREIQMLVEESEEEKDDSVDTEK